MGKRKISIGRGATTSIYRVSCGRHRCADGRLRPTTFYLGAVNDTTEQVAEAKRAAIRAEWKRLQAEGADEWTDEAIIALAARGIVSKQVSNRKIASGIVRSLVLPDDSLNERRINAQRAELRDLKDGNGMVRPECFATYMFVVAKQILTEPDCEARLRSDLRELALAQPREAVWFATELYKLLGKSDEKANESPVGLSITLVGPAAPTAAVVTPVVSAADGIPIIEPDARPTGL
jgi:hypothetical protein